MLLAQNLPEEFPTEVAATIGTGIIWGLIGLWIVIVVVALAFFIWWILMLVDCAKRDFPEKSTWLILLIVLFVLGFHWLITLLYYFIVYRKYKKTGETKVAVAK